MGRAGPNGGYDRLKSTADLKSYGDCMPSRSCGEGVRGGTAGAPASPATVVGPRAEVARASCLKFFRFFRLTD